MEENTVIEKARQAQGLDDCMHPEIPDGVIVVPHPVVPGVYALIEKDEWAWVLVGDEIYDAADTFDLSLEEARDPFFSAVIRPDNAWAYDPDPNIYEDETPVWTCMDRWDAENKRYAPTAFAVGETVYPILFHPNIPGGWTVYSADGKTSEYWQCS